MADASAAEAPAKAAAAVAPMFTKDKVKYTLLSTVLSTVRASMLAPAVFNGNTAAAAVQWADCTSLVGHRGRRAPRALPAPRPGATRQRRMPRGAELQEQTRPSLTPDPAAPTPAARARVLNNLVTGNNWAELVYGAWTGAGAGNATLAAMQDGAVAAFTQALTITQEKYILALTPIALSVVRGALIAAFTDSPLLGGEAVEGYLVSQGANANDPGFPALINATARAWALQQWTDCGPFVSNPATAASPYFPVDPSDPTKFPFAPELCAAITSGYQALGFGFPLTPQMLSDPAVALAINPAVAGAFLDAAIGTSSPATGLRSKTTSWASSPRGVAPCTARCWRAAGAAWW